MSTPTVKDRYRREDPENPRHDVAEQLEALSGGKVHVDFSPGTFHEDDEGALGHLFTGFYFGEDEADFVTLDDRQPEPLEEQLATELRRISRLFADLAEEVQAKAAVA